MAESDGGQGGGPGGRTRGGWRRARRWSARGLRAVGIVLGVVLLGVVATIGTPDGRRLLLRRALTIAEKRLPGHLTVARADWPTFSRLDLGGALWTDHGDTVLAARQVVVDLNPVALLHHELVINDLELSGAIADPARIGRVLPAKAAADTTRPKTAPFFRAGALPRLPSLAIHRLRVTDVTIRVPRRPPVRLAELSGSVDLRAGGKAKTQLALSAAPIPELGVAWSFAASLDDTLRVRTGRLELRHLGEGVAIPKPASSGSGGTLRIPRSSLAALGKGDLAAVTADLDSLVVAGDAGRYVIAARLAPPAGRLRLAADWPGSPRGLIGALLPARVPAERRADLLALVDTLDAGWPRDPAPGARLAIDVRDLSRALDALKRRDPGAAFAAFDSVSLNGAAGGGRLLAHFAPPGGSLTLEADLGQHPRRIAGALLPLVTLPEHRQDLAGLIDSISANWPVEQQPRLRAGLYLNDVPAALAAVSEKRLGDAVALLDSAHVTLEGGDYHVAAEVLPPRATLVATADWPRPPRFLLSLVAERMVAARSMKGASAATARAAAGTAEAARTGTQIATVAARPMHEAAQHAKGVVGGHGAESPADTTRAAPTDWLALADSLVRAWPTAGPPHLYLNAATEDLPAMLASRGAGADQGRAAGTGTGTGRTAGTGRTGRTGTLEARAEFLLPGPSAFTALLPPELDTSGWDALGGTAEARLTVTPGDTTWTARLDLAGTPWITTGRIQAHGSARSLTIEQLVFALPGFSLQSSGTLGGGHERITAEFAMPDASLLKRWHNPALASISDSLRGRLSIQGPWTRPTGRLDVTGGLTATGATVPRFDLSAAATPRPGGGSQGQVSLLLPEGLTLKGSHLKKLEVNAQGTLPEPRATRGAGGAPAGQGAAVVATGGSGAGADVDFTARLEGEHSLLAARGRITMGEVQTLRMDSLYVEMDKRQLVSQRPFTVIVEHEGAEYRIRDVDLAGPLGHVRVEGDLTQQAITLEATLDWEVPLEAARGLLSPAEVMKLPKGSLAGALQLKASGSPSAPQADLTFETTLTGNKQFKDLRLTGTGSLRPSLLSAQVQLLLSGDAAVTLDLRYPAQIAMQPFAVKPIPAEPIAVDLKAPGLDLKRLEPLAPSIKQLEGRLVMDVKLRGSAGESPKVDGNLEFSGAKARTDNGSWLTAQGKMAMAGTLAKPEVKGSIDVTGGVIRLPEPSPKLLPVSGRARLWQTPVGGAISEVDSILSPVRAPLAGVGPSGTPGLAAPAGPGGKTLAATEAPANLGYSPDRANAAPKDTLRTASVDTTRRPATPRGPGGRGSGRTGTPPPRYGAAGRDSTRGAKITAAKGAVAPQLDVDVSIPNGVLIHGHGADVRVRGHVTAHTAQDRYFALGGKLEAQQGTLQFLGRQFNLDSGSLIFHQDDVQIDPTLAIQMSTTLTGNTYNVQVSGTAMHPQITLTSEPPMAESDIMSNLVFGRTVGQLDTGEQQYLSQRAQEVVAAYGSAALSEQLSRTIGVDMLRLQNASDTSDSRSLLVGKYISPRVLVQYEQVLTQKTAFYVHLEYLLNRFFSVQTTVGEGASSGVAVQWSQDY